jgi:adenine-specific DNA-methyltransferase
MGLLNSKLINYWYYKNILDVSIRVIDLKNVPIYQLDFSKKSEKIKHDRIVELVKHLIGLHQQLDQSTVPHTGNILRRQIEAIDDEIDQQIYRLYELTNAEIEQVEAIFSAQ